MQDTRILFVQNRLNEQFGSLFQDSPILDNSLIELDGVFGNKTKAAFVIWLQLQLCELGYGVELDGVFGNKTKAALRDVNFAITSKTSGDSVVFAKYLLTCLGYSPDTTDRLSNANPRLSKVWAFLLKQYKEDHSLGDSAEIDVEFLEHVFCD